jgi:hypothetical protein
VFTVLCRRQEVNRSHVNKPRPENGGYVRGSPVTPAAIAIPAANSAYHASRPNWGGPRAYRRLGLIAYRDRDPSALTPHLLSISFVFPLPSPSSSSLNFFTSLLFICYYYYCYFERLAKWCFFLSISSTGGIGESLSLSSAIQGPSRNAGKLPAQRDRHADLA